MVVLRTQPLLTADDPGLEQLFASNSDTLAVIGGLYLAPFSGVAFLWFIAVVRDQIGDREDQFFATVFFGSGLLFVALLFVASAVASSLFVGVDYLRQPPPSVEEVRLVRSLAYTLLFSFGNQGRRRLPRFRPRRSRSVRGSSRAGSPWPATCWDFCCS